MKIRAVPAAFVEFIHDEAIATLEQGELESLARKTASYRADRISHSDMVSEILRTVRGHTIRVAALKSFPELRELRRGLALMKRAAMKLLESAVLREEFFHPGSPLAPYIE